MDPDAAEEYTQALGQVLAGGWRQILWGQQQGVPEALGLTTRQWVEDRVGGYIRLSVPERREAVVELTAPVEEGGHGLSTREAADVLGVSQPTVVADRKADQDLSPEPAPETKAQVTAPLEAEPITPDHPKPEEPVVVPDVRGAGGKLDRARLLRAYTKALHQATKDLLPLDQGAIADVLTDDEAMHAQAVEFAHDLKEWALRLERALHPLRAVKGDGR